MIRLKNVSKFYYSKGMITSGFSKVNLELNVGEFVVITGESGSGKSTLLNVISGLDTYEEGEMYVNGVETSHYTESDFERYRKKYVGNIFQNFNLVYSYTVYQNIELILLINGYTKEEAEPKVRDIIKKVGLEEFTDTKASKLSGGQKQRVAVARALAKETDMIVADEPTGNLDSESAAAVIKVLGEAAKDKLVVVVTHNYDQFEKYATRRIKMNDGRITEDEVFSKPKPSPEVLARLTGERGEDKKALKNAKAAIENEDGEGAQINLSSKIRLGLRNAFNIAPKFVLLLLVFMFLIFSVAGEYATLSKNEAELSANGRNSYFTNYSEDRIVINRDDGKAMTTGDYNAISAVSGIERVEKNDILQDSEYWAGGDMFSLTVHLSSLDNIKNVDYGRMPENDSETVIRVSGDNWYFSDQDMINQSLDTNVYVEDYNSSAQDLTMRDLKLVGVVIDDSLEAWTGTLYLSGDALKTAEADVILTNSQINITSGNSDIDLTAGEMYLVASDKVPEGEVYSTETLNGFFDDGQATGKNITVRTSNIYADSETELSVGRIMNGKTMESLMGIDDYDMYSGAIFVNPNDMARIAGDAQYQYSAYVKDLKDVDNALKSLNEMGYNPLSLKGAVYVDQISEAMFNIVQVPVILFLLVAVFFISYFVVKLILRSRSDYFVILRILGMNGKNTKRLLDIELMTVATVAYLIFIAVYIIAKNGFFGNSFIATLASMLSVPQLAVLYLIIILMVYLISAKFAKSMFKKSAMDTFREEA